MDRAVRLLLQNYSIQSKLQMHSVIARTEDNAVKIK